MYALHWLIHKYKIPWGLESAHALHWWQLRPGRPWWLERAHALHWWQVQLPCIGGRHGLGPALPWWQKGNAASSMAQTLTGPGPALVQGSSEMA